jgi:hypothetical protein
MRLRQDWRNRRARADILVVSSDAERLEAEHDTAYDPHIVPLKKYGRAGWTSLKPIHFGCAQR